MSPQDQSPSACPMCGEKFDSYGTYLKHGCPAIQVTSPAQSGGTPASLVEGEVAGFDSQGAASPVVETPQVKWQTVAATSGNPDAGSSVGGAPSVTSKISQLGSVIPESSGTGGLNGEHSSSKERPSSTTQTVTSICQWYGDGPCPECSGPSKKVTQDGETVSRGGSPKKVAGSQGSQLSGDAANNPGPVASGRHEDANAGAANGPAVGETKIRGEDWPGSNITDPGESPREPNSAGIQKIDSLADRYALDNGGYTYKDGAGYVVRANAFKAGYYARDVAQTAVQEHLLNDLQQILNVLDNKERTNPVRFAAIRFHASHALHQLRKATDVTPAVTQETYPHRLNIYENAQAIGYVALKSGEASPLCLTYRKPRRHGSGPSYRAESEQVPREGTAGGQVTEGTLHRSAPAALPLNCDMDANRWVREFRAAMDKLPKHLTVDDDFLRAWFANAIMCGFDVANQRASEAIPKGEKKDG